MSPQQERSETFTVENAIAPAGLNSYICVKTELNHLQSPNSHFHAWGGIYFNI